MTRTTLCVLPVTAVREAASVETVARAAEAVAVRTVLRVRVCGG